MKERIQARPGTWRLLISLVLILCAQAGLAAANEFSFSLSDALSGGGVPSGGQGELLVRFVPRDTPPTSCPDLVGPRTPRAVREAISGRILAGSSVHEQYDGVVPGLTLVKLPKGASVADAMMRFGACEDVLYAEPNYRYKLHLEPTDPNYKQQWDLSNTGQNGGKPGADIHAPAAWDIHTGAKGFKVAILDTGVDSTHPDLALNLWLNQQEMAGKPNVDDDGNGQADDFFGYDFIGNKSDPVDDVYHGTYVAGIIGAFPNNMMGIAGINWNISMIICKVADKDGAKLDAAVAAIQYATASGAKVINASWGGPDYSESLKDAIEAAGKKGVLFVAAAGNDSANNDKVPVYPANYDLDNIISVMATDNRDNIAPSSNYGPKTVDLAEPGWNVVSTTPMKDTPEMTKDGVKKEYSTLSGTSISAAHVSGVAALLWSKSPFLSVYHVKHILMQTADKVVPGLCLSHGRVNAAGALKAVPTGTLGRVRNTSDDPNTPLYTSLQAAIDAAKDGDTLIAEGKPGSNTIFLEQIDFQGKKITLRSGNIENPADPNLYPETTFILGLAKEGSIVTFANGEGRDSVLKGFTICWGVADYGAGIRCEDASPTISFCIISDNQARYYGGGIDCLGGAPEITNCVITDNWAFGASAVGGGINLEEATPDISDCIIRNNLSMSIGGGVACYKAAPKIFNCFVTNNAAAAGSGQFDLEDSSPTITSCTIVTDDFNPARDGGIWAFGDSHPIITNCILWGNGDDLFDASATYSCIEDSDGGAGNLHGNPQFTQGPRGYYYLSQKAAGQLTDSPCVNVGSPTTDSASASHLFLRTTRTDGVVDAGALDLGAHYGAAPAERFPLTITIVDDANQPVDPNQVGGTVDPNGGTFRQFEVVTIKATPKEGYRIKRWVGTPDDTKKDPSVTFTMTAAANLMIEFEKIPSFTLRTTIIGGHGTLSPYHRRGESYLDGTVVNLVAAPEVTYIVDRWEGTDNDASWANTNTVTIHGDTDVTVKFKQAKSFHVPAQYKTIADAIKAAGPHGDKVVVAAGTYQTHSLDFQGKALTVASEHPDDPDCVARTIIDCAQLGRAFIFKTGEGRDSVVDGFTIRNGYAVADPCTPTNTGGTGAGGEDAYGGAVAAFGGASPTLSNLIIQDCVARGRNGEDATFVYPGLPAPPAPPDPAPAPDQLPDPAPRDPNAPPDPNAPADPNEGMPGQAGADGAAGAAGADGAKGTDAYNGGRGGHGYGGAFYFDPNSKPLILHCTITNARALGGYGGSGGVGQDGQAGQDGQVGGDGQQGQNGGDGDPQGAGGNGGAGGAGGNGGRGGDGGIGGNGGDGGEALGGAIYFGDNCQPVIKYCTITNSYIRQGLGNAAGAGGLGGSGGGGAAGGAGADGGTGETDGAAGADGAAGVGGNGGNGGGGGSMGKNGTRSSGGAIYFGKGCKIEISDTVINSNSAMSTVPTVEYAGGAGGNGGAGGGPGGSGGNSGAGGDGGPAGAAGAPGAAGAQGGPGTAGLGGNAATSVTANFGGAIFYSEGCEATLTNCTLNSNRVENESGGAAFYDQNCTTRLERCSMSSNSAGLNGGALAFDISCKATILGCTFMSNTAASDGGALYSWYLNTIDVNETTFSANRATGALSSGGAVYAGGTWDDKANEWYNGSTVSLKNTHFTNNTAAFGGGLYWYGAGADICVDDCVIRGNTAQDGGGLYWSGGAAAITNCSIRGNMALGPQYVITVPAPTPDPNDPNTWPPANTWPDPNDPNSMFDPNNAFTPPPIQQNSSTNCGAGGGLVCWSSDASIEDCFIAENKVNGAGGGVYFGGDPFTPSLKNSLIKDNTALIGGGGIASLWYAAPTIANCTVVGNKASDPNISSRGYGGGLFCSYSSETTLLDSILWGNTARYGNQVALGSQSDPIYIQRPAILSVKFSDVQGGPTAIHVEQGATLNWLPGSIDEDPLFVASYYLSQTAAGQAVTSPAVDAGSDSAEILGLAGYTTRTDGVGDEDKVDMGFHYPTMGRNQLTVAVIGGHGTVQPPAGKYYDFEEVTLTAQPEPGYRVKQWIGTKADPSWNKNTSVVVMDSENKFVTVEFEQAVTRILIVPTQYRTIEEAVAAASPGGTNIVLNQGVHTVTDPMGIDLLGKNIRIMSTDPNNPTVVDNTIIDAQGARFSRHRAFHFHSGETSECRIEGITIKNALWIGDVGVSGGGWPQHYIIPDEIPGQDTSVPRPERMASGADANGIAYGGAILCENGSSPTFRNCIIRDCMALGSWAGDGLDGPPIPSGTNQDGYWGGHGGTAHGLAYGGAIACLTESKPTFIGCTIRDCTAKASIGGDGGNGSTPNLGSGRESWGGDANDAYGDGRGGAVYCEDNSDAAFGRCVFANNRAVSGDAGRYGLQGPGAGLSNPYPNPAGPGNAAFTFPDFVAGGAIYQNGAVPKFVDCQFIQNESYETYSLLAYLGSVQNAEERLRVHTRGGAIYASPGDSVSLKRCQFTENRSGAVFVEGSQATVDANNCVFTRNAAGNSDDRVSLFIGTFFALRAVPTQEVGGAMYIGPFCADVTLRGCDFQSNTSVGDGGAIRLFSNANMAKCSFSGNRSEESGGAVDAFLDSGDPNTPTILSVNLEACTFGGNQAAEGFYAQGGALHFEDCNAVLTDCYVLSNKAKSGGGIFHTSGLLKLCGGSVSGNTATGNSGVDTTLNVGITNRVLVTGDPGTLMQLDIRYANRHGFSVENPGLGLDMGGGLVVAGADAKIEDCMFTRNRAEGIKGSGGAISFYGGSVSHVVRNCLFADNYVKRDGGAVWAGLFAQPEITNSTFAKNTADRLGGAIFCEWSSNVTVSDSIFNRNREYAVAEEDFGKSEIKCSLFSGNTPADYGLYDSVTRKTIAQTGTELSPTNLSADPQFADGPLGDFYLSQKAAGQEVTSPAVDAGSKSASQAGMTELTTRTDGVADTGQVDLGYHFPDHNKLPKYTLKAEVIGGHGTIEPTGGTFYAGTVVQIKATPESGWRVAQWAGTGDDASKKKENVVIIGPDRHVTVRFEQPKTIVVASKPEYTTIQYAIDAAQDGDVVMIPSGQYAPDASSVYPWGTIRIHGKTITLTGTNPDDPNVVANTMLAQYRIEIRDVGPETVIDGLTIGDVNWVGANGIDGSGTDGNPGVSLLGGAMTIFNASPTIRNCRFIDCSITGGNGGNGANGVSPGHPNGWDGGWAGWAYGGAVYIGFQSNPTFQNCLFENCRVYGGNGGNGGNAVGTGWGGRGGNRMESEALEQNIRMWWDGWEFGLFDRDGKVRGAEVSTTDDPRGYYDDYWRYSGYGGAVYIEYYSAPKFIDCNFADNHALGGVSGIGGIGTSSTNPIGLPDRNLNVESFGGAVYAARASNPEFIGCAFSRNSADVNMVTPTDDVYLSYGGSVAIEFDCKPVFTRCTIQDSNACIGGGLYWSKSMTTISDCNITKNVAFHGGGMYCVDSTGTIADTLVNRNLAFQWTIDPNFSLDPNVPFAGVSSEGGGFCGINSPVKICDSIFSNNHASTSGGGIYFGGSDQDLYAAPVLYDCLIVANGAGRDGGGVSVNWYNEPTISNCTIADNFVANGKGDAFGGGLSVAYDANAVLTDSIVWGNNSTSKGAQLSVANGYPYGARPSSLHVYYSDIGPAWDASAPREKPLDLVFVFDSSATMSESMTDIKVAAARIVGRIAGKVPDYRMAVVDFKDFNDTVATGYGAATDYPYRVVTPFTDRADRVVSGINSIATPAGSGGDTPDSIFYALTSTADGNDLGPWRGGNVDRVILLVGDVPPHDPEAPSGYTLATTALATAKDPGTRVFTLQVGEDPATEIYFRAIAGIMGGAAVQVPDPNNIVAGMLEAMDLITKAAPPVYVSPQSCVPGWDAQRGVWLPETHNLVADPLFVAGYYLSQTAAGQARQSPAVDAGSASVDAQGISLGDRTTRTDGVPDKGTVDLGYHYAHGVTLYKLTAQVLPDADDGMIHATVTPNTALVYEGSSDKVIRLEVKCQPGWKIKKWTGTDNDSSTLTVNFVTLTKDSQVTVVLEKRTSRVVTVPGDFKTIQDAVTAAEEGDTIIVEPGIYTSGHSVEDANGVRFALVLDKAVTVTSRKPDDPTVVASTIIRGPGTVGGNQLNNQGILFRGETTRQTVFSGFTLENFGGSVVNGGNAGNRGAGHPDGYDGAPVNGSAMILLRGASPTIKNCIIRNNFVIAGNGGAGAAADATHNAGRGGWGGWARGGAIYCAADTNPKFINCIIENNSAQGGNGGNGGAGVANGGLANYGGNYCPPVRVNIDPDKLGTETAESELWNVWEWDYALAYASGEALFTVASASNSGGHYIGDYRWYSGYGGGVFLDLRSKAEFIECTIRGNSTLGGLSGQGGANAVAANAEPQVAFEIPSYGGGVYCAADTTVLFKNCLFQNNASSVTATQNNRLDPYVGFGGGVAAERTAGVRFVDCNFVDNEADTGGGLYLAESNVTMVDNRIRSNTALRGAGLTVVGGAVNIFGGELKNNEAILDATDTSDDLVLPVGAGVLFSSANALIQDCNIAGNTSGGSGGGIYLQGESWPSIINCLIRDNLAFRDGGGISSNWFAAPTIRNCTFYSNAAPGLPADPNHTGFGGGVFCGYGSDCKILDSILWQDFARLGTELAVGTGFELDPHCGKIFIAYTDIWAGLNDVFVDDGCKVIYGEGILHVDPLFVSTTLGSFFLSNRATGQKYTSPCVDAGSDLAGVLGMSHYTTRIDRVPDTGIVDLGFHYRFLEPCRFCDLVHDGVIRFDDFALFAMKWLKTGCSEANGWCGGADFTFDTKVDYFDLAMLADCWLVRDTLPPMPNPPQWLIAPEMDGLLVRMEAKAVIDAWGWPVEYFFECVQGEGHDSGWQTDRTYIDKFLKPGQKYGYRFKARDALGNETKWSTTWFAGLVDTSPPAPAPYIVTITAVDSQSVTMTARTAYDDFSGVQYYFDTNTPGGHDSGWINTPTYTDANLIPSTRYYYRVKARDMSSRLNETVWSDWVSVVTQTPADTTAPTPNPMAWDPNGQPHELYGGGGPFDYYADMTAVTATDATGPVQYYFEAVDYPDVAPNGFSSGWINTPTWRVQVGRQNAAVRFRVKARDGVGNETAWSTILPAVTPPGTTVPPIPTAGGTTGPGGTAGTGVIPGAGGLVVP